MAAHDDQPFALDVIRSWPDAAREAAHRVLLAHGPPATAADDGLRWEHLGPWKRVAVCPGDDPAAPVESVVDAAIPDDRRADVDEVADELHVTVEDDGELSVRGPDMKANVVTLNVVHAIVHDGLGPAEARTRHQRDMADLRDGHPPADAEELHFADDAPHGEPRTITPLADTRHGVPPDRGG